MCHGDFRPANVAILPGPVRRLALIDWGAIGRGPGGLDLGSYLLWTDGRVAAWAAVVACARSGVRISMVSAVMAPHACSRCIVLPFLFESRDGVEFDKSNRVICGNRGVSGSSQ